MCYLLVNGPSASVMPSALPPFFAKFLMIGLVTGWKTSEAKNDVELTIGWMSVCQISRISWKRSGVWASFLNVVVQKACLRRRLVLPVNAQNGHDLPEAWRL